MGIPVCRRTGLTLSEGGLPKTASRSILTRQKAERRRGECAERALSKGFEEIDEATYTAKERQRAGHRKR
jgi:hypothetical protein